MFEAGASCEAATGAGAAGVCAAGADAAAGPDASIGVTGTTTGRLNPVSGEPVEEGLGVDGCILDLSSWHSGGSPQVNPTIPLSPDLNHCVEPYVAAKLHSVVGDLVPVSGRNRGPVVSIVGKVTDRFGSEKANCRHSERIRSGRTGVLRIFLEPNAPPGSARCNWQCVGSLDCK